MTSEPAQKRRSFRDNVMLGVTLFMAVFFVSLSVLLVSRGLTPTDAAPGWTSVDFLTVILGVMAVAFNVLLVFLAVLAIFGYQFLSSAAERRAEHAAEERVKSFLESDEFAELLSVVVDEAVDHSIQESRDLGALVEKAEDDDIAGELERAIKNASGGGEENAFQDKK